jgi:hypothetical protein
MPHPQHPNELSDLQAQPYHNHTSTRNLILPRLLLTSLRRPTAQKVKLIGWRCAYNDKPEMGRVVGKIGATKALLAAPVFVATAQK